MAAKQIYKRWYDRQPQLAKAVRVMILMPEEVCSIMGEGLINLMQTEGHEILMETRYRSLGTEKVLGLHKSKNRRREYDQNETLHRAMNALYRLSDEGQDFIAAHILLMLNSIQHHLSTRRDFQPESTAEDIALLTQRYIAEGSVGVENFLRKLREEFLQQVATGPGSRRPPTLSPGLVPDPETDTRITTKDNHQGMKIRKLELD